MQNPTTQPTTTCGQHRILGYAFKAGRLACRGCGLPADYHETTDQTAERNRRDAAISDWIHDRS